MLKTLWVMASTALGSVKMDFVWRQMDPVVVSEAAKFLPPPLHVVHVNLTTYHVCYNFSVCDNGDVRIVGDSLMEGAVEICSSNSFGSICDDFWDELDARVVCGQLQFINGMIRWNSSKQQLL